MSDTVPDVYEFSEDTANAEQPPLLPNGEYRATVRGSKIAKSKTSGNNMVQLDYVIAPEEYPADFEGPADGTKGTGYVTLSDDATGRYRYRKACEAHGVTPSRRVDANEFMGQDVMVRVESSMYQGEMRYNPFNAVRPA
jgi:hypothetical protein